MLLCAVSLARNILELLPSQTVFVMKMILNGGFPGGLMPCDDHVYFLSDYGYARSDSFTGVCVRDSTVPLPSGECLAGQTTHLVSQGYRKIAGDVCSGGVEGNLGPVSQSCCATTPGMYVCVCICICVYILSRCVSSSAVM